MADVDIDPFGDHAKTDSHPDEGENIPLTPGGGVIGGSTWEPESEQERLFREMRNFSKSTLKGCTKSYLKALTQPKRTSL